jgi:hypothetical protein
VHACILDFWRSKTACFEEWRVGRLKLLQKKGGLSDPSIWRGIMLLDVMVKMGASIVESTCKGGRGAPERLPPRSRLLGCIFSLKMGGLDGPAQAQGAPAGYVGDVRRSGVKAFDSVDAHWCWTSSVVTASPSTSSTSSNCWLLHTDVTVRFAVGKIPQTLRTCDGASATQLLL